MSQLVIQNDMTNVFSNNDSALSAIAAFASQSSTLDGQDHHAQHTAAAQNVYVHTSSPNTGDPAVTTHSPYTPGPPFEYQMPQEKMVLPVNDYPGDYGFEIYFGEKTPSAPKNAQYTHSSILNKLFVKMNVTCPIHFKCNVPPPQGCIIKATPIFKRAQHIKDIVTRCPNHKITDTGTPNHIPVNHLIRVEMPTGRHNVQYNYGADGRESVSVIYENPQVGTEYSTVLFKFMCLSSCVGGINRRPLMLVFTFENMEGQVLGRRAVEMRVCSCPGRDRAQEEKRVMRRDTLTHGQCKREEQNCDIPEIRERNTETVVSPVSSLLGKRRRQNGDPESEEYFLKIRGREKYDILKRVKEALDLMEYVAPRQQELYRIHEREEGNRLVRQIATRFLKREHDQHLNKGTILQSKLINNNSSGGGHSSNFKF
uniref:cellular tumor antigen p53-like n=1 Tax=Styela clava TaxID=7725 RepID=UPI00193ACBE2|nr:cellular tumor antigen p53-like [Styela clava]